MKTATPRRSADSGTCLPIALLLALSAVFTCSAAQAGLQITTDPTDAARLARRLQLDEQGAATQPAAGADAVPAKDWSLLIGLGLRAFTDDAPERSIFPYAWALFEKRLPGNLDLSVFVGGPIVLAKIGTNDVEARRVMWGWEAALYAQPFKMDRQLYFDGDSVDPEAVGEGGGDLTLRIYRQLWEVRLGAFYSIGVRYYNAADDMAAGFVLPPDTLVHRAGVFAEGEWELRRDRLGQLAGGRLFSAEVFGGFRGEWDPWGAPGRVRSTDDSYFKARAGFLGVVPGAREKDTFAFNIKGGLSTGLDRFNAYPIGSSFSQDPAAYTRREGATVRGFFGSQFLATNYAALNLEYTVSLHEFCRLHLCLDAAAFDRITPQTVGADGTTGAVGVGFGLTTGFLWESRLRFDYGVGVVGPDDGDTGIHEFRLSVIKKF